MSKPVINYRKTQPVLGGRRIVTPSDTVRTVRHIMREHLAFHRMTFTYDLSAMLGIANRSAVTMMNKKYPIAPQHIDAFIEGMKLDEFDALELRLQGAIEYGWQLTPLKKHAKV